MKKSKLNTLFKTLNSTELRELKQFVRSSFHNQRSDVVNLFDALREIKDFKRVDERQVFEKVYSGKPYVKSTFAHVCSYLLSVIEHYLVHKEMNKDHFQHSFHLAKVYRKRGMEVPFSQQMKKAQKTLKSSGLKNIESYANRFKLASEVYAWQKERVRGEGLNLQELADQLDIFLIGKKLHLGCMLLSNANLYEVEYHQGLLTKILAFLEEEDQQQLLELPAISLQYYSLKTLLTEEEFYFLELKKKLESHASEFTKIELRDFYVIAINFSIKRLNLGQQEYVRETFDLYRKGLLDKVFLENNTFSQFHFKNIAALGLGLKEFNWVELFLKAYKPFLEIQNRENAYNYNMAKLHYERKEYSLALKLLQVVKYENLLPKLTAKILLIKIYFELDEKEVLESHLKSFETAVRRQRAIGYHKESYLNLVQLMRKTLLLNPFDKAAKNKLRKRVEDTKVLPEKKWLLEVLGS